MAAAVRLAWEVTAKVLGDGPFDLVLIPGYVSHIELAWEFQSLGRD